MSVCYRWHLSINILILDCWQRYFQFNVYFNFFFFYLSSYNYFRFCSLGVNRIRKIYCSFIYSSLKYHKNNTVYSNNNNDECQEHDRFCQSANTHIKPCKKRKKVCDEVKMRSIQSDFDSNTLTWSILFMMCAHLKHCHYDRCEISGKRIFFFNTRYLDRSVIICMQPTGKKMKLHFRHSSKLSVHKAPHDLHHELFCHNTCESVVQIFIHTRYHPLKCNMCESRLDVSVYLRLDCGSTLFYFFRIR